MEFNKLVFGGLALGCLAAAGAGGYLAARQTHARDSASVTAPADVGAPTPGTAPGSAQPVAESEGVIAPEAAPPSAPAAAAPAAPSTAAPARRESAPRP